jgi:hypothetical protein
LSAVSIKGTFSKTERSDNGLERISKDLVVNEFARHVVVGIVELHKVTKQPGEAPIPTVRFLAIEPVEGDDDVTVRAVLDRARRERGLGDIGDTLFDVPAEGFDFDGPAGGEVEGQMRLTGDGPREVPEPSGEEIIAEREEQKAARGEAKADPFTAGSDG